MNNSRRNLYIWIITACIMLVVLLIAIIMLKSDKKAAGQDQTLIGGNSIPINPNNPVNPNNNNNNINTGTVNCDIVIEKTSIKIGETVTAKAVFQNGISTYRWTTDSNAISVSNEGLVTGKAYGSAKLCVELTSTNARKCIEIKVADTFEEFKNALVSDYGYRQTGMNTYNKDKYSMDLNKKVFSYYEKTEAAESLIAYHYGQTENYVESVVKTNNYTVILRYITVTGEYECQSSPSGSQEYICSSVKAKFEENARNMMNILKGYLEPNLKLSDIY